MTAKYFQEWDHLWCFSLKRNIYPWLKNRACVNQNFLKQKFPEKKSDRMPLCSEEIVTMARKHKSYGKNAYLMWALMVSSSSPAGRHPSSTTRFFLVFRSPTLSASPLLRMIFLSFLNLSPSLLFHVSYNILNRGIQDKLLLVFLN